MKFVAGMRRVVALYAKKSMSGKLDIQWAPSGDRFITCGSELCLYQVENITDGQSPNIRLSDTTGANLLGSIPHSYFVKCLDVNSHSENEILLALGQSSGKISITSIGNVYDQTPNIKEVGPRFSRACNSVAWNPLDNKLAGGFEKHRSDHCILLWDVVKNYSDKVSISEQSYSNRAACVSEFGLSESAHSIGWFQSNSRLLAAGMNMKSIKIIDFRDTTKFANSTFTKAVYGVTVKPNNDQHLASFAENQISVWDTRNFEKPIITLPSARPLLKISWCPTKTDLLAALHKDSNIIHLYGVQHSVIGNDEVEPSVLEREIRLKTTPNLSSFAWHPSDEYRLLTISTTNTLLDYTVFDRITLNWAPNSNLIWTHGRKKLKNISKRSKFHADIDDISEKMKERTIKGYGLEQDLAKNAMFIEEDMLVNVWNWLALSQRLVEEGLIRGQTGKHPGIKDVLKLESASNKSEMLPTTILDMGNNTTLTPVKIYRHEDRSKALQLCGWNFNKDLKQGTIVDQLIAAKCPTRAAAIAVFNLKLRSAIEILTANGEQYEHFNVVAMALAGFSDDKNSMWRQFCSCPKFKLTDPYLRAMFAFLTAENYNYDAILHDDVILVEDRVAFACTFLSDHKLYEYLKSLTSKLIQDGDLNGMLLTGSSQDGARLLQRYLDLTGDIQSTVLIAVHAFNADLLAEVADWITGYRNLLDSWQLWNQRALFDIMLSGQNSNDKPPQQVHVSCNFCGKSISAYMQANRGRAQYPRMGGTANKLKLSSCPNCRKPLPRCVICLMHMGTTTGVPDAAEADSNKLSDFSGWFTWCQTCRHGGHASHMTHWFKEHSECPVTACTCRCFSIDTVTNMAAVTS